jgi:hypothetical protein
MFVYVNSSFRKSGGLRTTSKFWVEIKIGSSLFWLVLFQQIPERV